MDEYVSNCSACGKSHSIKFYKLFVPKIIRGAEYEYMGYCSNANRYVYRKRWLCGPGESVERSYCVVGAAA
ncbi:MAG: hypothetical protein ACXABY_27395 [Candidatus Thorarchaeota archaeon]|jgi:hypothetical protein